MDFTNYWTSSGTNQGGGGGVARVFGRSGGGGNNGDLIPAVPERVLELAVDVQSSQGPDAVRDADRAGEAPPLLVLHDEHEVPGAARADLVGPRVVLAGVVQIQRGLLLVDADVPRDEGRDLSEGERAVARPAVAREDVEEDGAAEEDVGVPRGIRGKEVVQIRFSPQCAAPMPRGRSHR